MWFGVHLVKKFTHIDDDVKIILIIPFDIDDNEIMILEAVSINKFLQKPIHFDKLSQIVINFMKPEITKLG